MRIGIVAALPGELKPLVKGWERVAAGEVGVRLWRRTQGGNEVLAGCGGMGAEAARRCFVAMEAHGALDGVLSVGWAGALAELMGVGECFAASEVIDAQTGERFSMEGGATRQVLVTTARVADGREKQRLRESYDAVVVDMEAAAVARLAQMRGIPMWCFKAVSDGLHAELPDLNPFISNRGQLNMFPFLLYVAVRPRFWRPLAQLGGNSSAGAKKLALRVEEFLRDAGSKEALG